MTERDAERDRDEPALAPDLRLPPDPDAPAWAVSATGSVGMALPVPLTSFVGREAEVAAIAARLRRGDARLLALTGPGGVGKTRLALRVGDEAAAVFADGVVFVPLAAIADPELVVPTVARVLGVREHATQPVAETLADLLRPRHLLLILDNIEQVRGAASQLAALLAACPDLAILVTSRALLNIAGEQRVPVAPLALPDSEMDVAAASPASAQARIAASPAVQLFVARAREVDPRFVLDAANAAAIAAICRRLDGLPLAIELAAARTHLLAPAELLARLHPALPLLSGGPDDAPNRLRTMRNAIAWSYDLLTAEEQRLFRTLSVFVGGFTLDAAEAVAGGGRRKAEGATGASASRLPPPASRLDLLAALVDKSLVFREPGPGQTRYALLETVREFGLEALATAGDDDAAHDAHAAWSLAFAADAETGLAGPDFAAWVDRVRAELGNVRAAHAWLFARGDAERGLRLAGRLGWFWASGGYLHEGRSLFDRLVAMPGAAEAKPDLAHALHAAGDVEQWLGALDRAEARFTRALAIYRELGDARGEIAMLRGLGSLAVDGGDLERAEALLREVLERSPETGTPWEAASAANVLGIIAFTRGDYVASLRYCEAAETGWRSLDDTGHVPSAKITQARAALAAGDPSRAAALARDVLAELTDAGGDLLVCSTFEVVAALALAAGDAAAAARLLAVADAAQRLLETQRWPVMQAMFEAMVGSVRHTLGEPAFQIAWASGAGQSLAEAIVGAVQTLDGLDAAFQAKGRVRAEKTLLTPRERDVLRLLVDGLSDKEIAAALGIGRRTASTHVAAIRAKLGAPSRSAAAAIAARDGLV